MTKNNDSWLSPGVFIDKQRIMGTNKIDELKKQLYQHGKGAYSGDSCDLEKLRDNFVQKIGAVNGKEDWHNHYIVNEIFKRIIDEHQKEVNEVWRRENNILNKEEISQGEASELVNKAFYGSFFAIIFGLASVFYIMPSDGAFWASIFAVVYGGSISAIFLPGIKKNLQKGLDNNCNNLNRAKFTLRLLKIIKLMFFVGVLGFWVIILLLLI